MYDFTTSPTPLYASLVDEIDCLMTDFAHTKKDIWYGRRWTFNNGMWFDLIDYRKEDIYILRVGRGAWLVQQHPILHGYFDVVSKVIAKLEISSVEQLESRGVRWLFQLLADAPGKIGVL